MLYYFILPKDMLLKHGDDLRDSGFPAYSTLTEAATHLESSGFIAMDKVSYRWRNSEDQELYIAHRQFDPYSQRWNS